MLIGAKYSFSAAMQLPEYEGNCAQTHGYNFELTITLEVETSAKLSVDVAALDAWVNETLLSKLDRTNLETVVAYPSLEGSLLWIAQKVFPNWADCQSIELVAGSRYFASIDQADWRARIDA